MRFPFAVLVVTAFAAATSAAPPGLPADFATPQSAARPAPFPLAYVDHGKADPRLAGYQTPEGFKLEIVATEAVVVNPVGMTFAPDGTLFVLEWKPDPGREWYEFRDIVRYRDGTSRTQLTMKKFVSDPVKIVRYNATTGTFDRSDVVLTDELPSSILVHDGWLYLSGRGSVRRYKQSKPGGFWDVRETVAHGFCGYHHHQVSGMTIGNDGLLYITTGDDDNVVEGSDGSRATALRTGAIFRCRPDGANLELFSTGYRNPYRDLAYDDAFNWFHADNDNEDGTKFTGCRLVHVPEGADYGWRLATGAKCCRPDFLRGAVAGERPGTVPPMLKTGRGSPAGVLLYHDTQLPEQYRGLMYYPDVFRRVIRGYGVKPAGSTFHVASEFELLRSDDPLFRPCQMTTGPDGAVYICDWRTDSGGAGKLWGDGVHGRILRLTWAGTPDHPAIPTRDMDGWAKLLKLPTDDLAVALGRPDLTDRVAARNELFRRGAAGRAAVRAHFDALPPGGKLAALGVLQTEWDAPTEAFFVKLLNDPAADVRRLACDGLGRRAGINFAVADALTKALTDESLPVRRSAAFALARVGPQGAADSLVSTWLADDGKDRMLADGYLKAVEKLGPPGFDALLAAADSGDNLTRDRVAVAFTAFRTRPAAAALLVLVGNPHLTPGQRADLVRAFANFQLDPPLSLEPLADALTTRADGAAAVTEAALEVFAATGGLTGPKATKYVLKVLDSSNPALRASAYQAVADARLSAALPALLGKLPAAAGPEKIALLKSIRVVADGTAAAPLAAVLAGPDASAVKVEALRAFAAADPAAAAFAAEPFLVHPDPALIAEAVATLAASKTGAKFAGERYLAGKLPRDVWPRVAEGLKKFDTDPALAKLHADVARGGLILSTQPAELEKIRRQVMTKGDPKKGRELYLNTAVLSCVTCHRMEGVGGQVGPDLTRVWDTHTLDKLMESLAQPSKEIKEGYQSYRVSTNAGQVFVGLKVSDTPAEIVIREASGRDIRVKRDDIDEVAPSKLSLMPDDAAARITYDQLIDLLAFLKSKSTQESLRGGVYEFNVATGFDPDLAKVNAPESIPAGGPVGAEWAPRPTDPFGYLLMKPLLPTQPAGAYALAWVFSPKPQTVSAVLLGDDPVKVWVGKGVVFERGVPKHLPLATEEKFAADVPAGWSPVLVKIVSTGPSHRLGLRFSGDGVRAAVRPEAK